MPVGGVIRDAAAQTARPALSGISQTAFIFGAVGFMFLVFITLRGDLPKWLGLLGLARSAAPSTGQIGSVSASPPSGMASASNVVQFPTPPQLGTVIQ